MTENKTSKSFSLKRRELMTLAAILPVLPEIGWAGATALPLGSRIVQLFDPETTAADRLAFHAASISPAGQKRWPAERFAEMVGAISSVSGGFDLSDSRQIHGTVWLQLQARRQGVTRVLRVRLDRDDPTRVFDLSLSPMPTPYEGPTPTGPLTPEEFLDLVDRRIRYSVDRDEFSGAVQITTPDGEPVYRAAFGNADRERGEPNNVETRFNLGSIDKSFCALVIGQLLDEGELALETTIDRVLPDYPNVAFARSCTIRQLLGHASGLGMLFDRPEWENRRPYSKMSDLFYAFAAEAPRFPPGARAAYSNEGFIVLGAVAEAVTGVGWYELLDKRIYKPAGMTSSGQFRYAELPPGTAVGYRYHETDHLGLSGRIRNEDFLGYRGNSCGGGYSTVSDMARYLAALRAGWLTSGSTLQTMITQQQPGLGDYGLGFNLQRYDGGALIVGHKGGGAHSGINSDAAISWGSGWSYAVLGNYDSPFAQTLSADLARWMSALGNQSA